MVLFQVIDKFSSDFAKSAFKFETVKTDTTVFRLHYKLSVWLVVMYSVCYMYVAWSNPISCMSSTLGDNGIDGFRKEVNDYCWVHGTYVVSNLNPAHQIFPGIGGVTGKHGEIRYHHYYKWMYFYIACMIILLHTPRQFWRSIESGRMKSLVQKLKCIILIRNDIIEREKESLVEYLYCHLGYHRRYAFGFVFGEFLNVAVSSFLMYLWDYITEHEFSLHGGTANFAFMQTPPSLRTDRLAKVFPILGKCNFNTYGPSGGIQPHDFICVLPLNLINERAAIFFWYYFMVLVSVGICALICRIILISSKRLRMSLLCSLTPLTAQEDVTLLADRCSYSDWFVIYQLGCCVEPVLFREVMQMFVIKIKSKF